MGSRVKKMCMPHHLNEVMEERRKLFMAIRPSEADAFGDGSGQLLVGVVVVVQRVVGITVVVGVALVVLVFHYK